MRSPSFDCVLLLLCAQAKRKDKHSKAWQDRKASQEEQQEKAQNRCAMIIQEVNESAQKRMPRGYNTGAQ